jgi:hypothetical protein
MHLYLYTILLIAIRESGQDRADYYMFLIKK